MGLLIGAAFSYGLHRTLESYLFKTAPADPIVWIAVAAILLASAGIATTIPALRAVRMKPADALRLE